MKRISFLARLHKENKLALVEPSQIMKTAYIQRANESLSSAKVLLNIRNLKDSVALSYYAMYHSLLALLFAVGIKCENHAAGIILLTEVFRLDNSAISSAKAERVDKQYYVDFNITQEEVRVSIRAAEDFIAGIIDFTEKLSISGITGYRNSAAELIL